MRKSILSALVCAIAMMVCTPADAQGKKELKYWGSPDNYLDAQGLVMLELVDQAMDLFPPTTDFCFERKQMLYNFDAVVHNTKYDNSDLLRDFTATRIAKIVADLDKPMKKGVKVYKIYNDGFIIRTAKSTIAVDLNGRNNVIVTDGPMQQLVDRCEALFLTHNHADHCDRRVVDMFTKQGKEVVAVDEFWPDNEKLNHVYPDGDYKDITVKLGKGDMKVRIFPGFQDNLHNCVYVFQLLDGYTVMHTGDQYEETDKWIERFSSNLPCKKLDILIVECWINFMPDVLKAFDPKVIITGHEDEMMHTIDHREAFWLTYYKMEEKFKVETPYVIMGWGEWFDFK